MEKRGRPLLTVMSFLVIALTLCALCLGEFLLAEVMGGKNLGTSATPKPRRVCVVIDAGHGGIDGGAVGVDGSLEKDINLAVAKRLRELLELTGIECVMTREEDRLVVDDSVRSHRKMHDLKNRVAIVNAQSSPIFVSIHMNKYPSEKYSGLQVWYSKHDPESKGLAAQIQAYAATFLMPENTRKIKQADSSIYVLDRLRVPAVLIECGFLSNHGECARLASEEYRGDLAVTIFAAILSYLGGQ